MSSAIEALQARSPLSGEPSWQRLREAAYHLIDRRASQAGGQAIGDEADARLVACLADADLSPDPSYAKAWLWDLGIELGRHVYSKPVVGDDLDKAVEVVGHQIRTTGLGEVELAGTFHRTATVRFEPAPPADQAEPDALWALLAGLVTGALSEALNCEVSLGIDEPGHLEISLGTGRDVNKGARNHG